MKHPTTTSHVCRTHYVAVIPVVTLRSSTIICPKTPQSAFFAVLSLHWRRASMHSKIAAQVLCIDGTFLTGRYKGTMLIAIAADEALRRIKKGNSMFSWKKLDELTNKQAAELRRRGVNAEHEEPIAMEDVGLDGPNVRRRPRSFDQVVFRVD
ncbi:hypothetical protein U9M48_041522 [Paspalum notatum var. saurae]|uniref:Uncharacterized protein n=1 Tax=Paspalum notatum var. saurae TaxID=547442 RepID=A0AAQ3UPD9_PASNO